MRFIKRQSTNLRSLQGKGIHYDEDDQVILESKNSLLIPKGTTSDRPVLPENGHLRYNTSNNEFELYQDNAWRKMRFKEPNQNPGIKVQTFGPGDGTETYFGILNSQDPDYPIPAAEQNILVFVENVFQIPTTNYLIVQNPAGKPPGYYLSFGTPIPLGKLVTVIHNFDK